MGKFFHFHCETCGFDQKFRVGGGFFTKEYWEETDKLELQLKKELSEGKYGDFYQMLAVNGKYSIQYQCETELFQCRICKALTVRRGKGIYYSYSLPTSKYNLYRLYFAFLVCLNGYIFTKIWSIWAAVAILLPRGCQTSGEDSYMWCS